MLEQHEEQEKMIEKCNSQRLKKILENCILSL